jgi:hypothetical protein
MGYWRSDLVLGFFFFIIVMGYIVSLTKFFTIYQIDHARIHPIHHSPLFLPIPAIVSIGIISIYIHKYVIFLLYSLTPFPFILPHPMGTHSPYRTCFDFLFSVFVKKQKHHFCLFQIAIQMFPCDIFMYICIITQIGSSLFFSFLP